MDSRQQEYAMTEKAKIARLSRRSAASEASSIWSFGGALIYLFLVLFAQDFIIRLSLATGFDWFVIMVMISVISAGLLGWLHLRRMKPRIAAAQRLDTSFKYAQQEKIRLGRNAKIAAMQKA